ncbi:hypothetical protein SprV_0502006200 [Sparganum proliferum]
MVEYNISEACANLKKASKAINPLDIEQVCSVFVLFLTGFFWAFIVSIIEFCVHNKTFMKSPVVGRHLKALRMRLASVTEAWSGILSVDPTGVAVEDDATLSSLLLANEWIVSALQRYHHLELGVQHQHHELPATGYAATVSAVGAAGVLQIPPSAVSFSPRRAVSTALSTPTKVSARTVAEVNTVIARQRLRTSVAKILDTVEEQLGRFQELAAEIEGPPAHLSGTEAQILELGFVVQSLGVFHEMLAFTIEDSSEILGKEDEPTLAGMMQANDAIVIALDIFQRLLLNGQHQFAEVCYHTFFCV